MCTTWMITTTKSTIKTQFVTVHPVGPGKVVLEQTASRQVMPFMEGITCTSESQQQAFQFRVTKYANDTEYLQNNLDVRM